MSFGELRKALGYLHGAFPTAKLLISTSAPRTFEAFKELRNVSQDIPTIGLQFSVHESTDESRKRLIPSATMTLQEIANEGVLWSASTGRKPFFNYCVHPKNDTEADADRLMRLFNPKIWEATLSVICERDEHIAAANERQRKLAEDFSAKLLSRGYGVRVFNPAGQDDIGGGCGQLWYVQDWMNSHPNLAKPTAGFGKDKVHTPH